ncbi:MAG: hypothetical protein LJE84_05965 [Gammaproteobacteria bacterium]|nr:hypothetical protein [Gammaproteobacteria bacterium]
MGERHRRELILARRLEVGWLVGGQSRWGPRPGALAAGGSGLARCVWIARQVNETPQLNARYRLYRPWRRFDVLVFLKFMSDEALRRMERQRHAGGCTVFDLNVNYFESLGTSYYQGMLPTPKQQQQVRRAAATADAVIADSRFLEERARPHARRVLHIPDSVDFSLVPEYRPRTESTERLQLLWSGEAVKLFELLAIEDVLREFAQHVEIIMVSNDRAALARWSTEQRQRFDSLLAAVPHRFLRFRSVPELLRWYADTPGVVISPRHLDNSYNPGHTEWKISLGMACGRMALCSPVPSYVEVARLSGQRGIRVCADSDQWRAALDELLAGKLDREAEERAACEVIRRNYDSALLASRHVRLLRELAAASR